MNQFEVSNVPIWPIYHLARRVEGKKAAFVASPRAAVLQHSLSNILPQEELGGELHGREGRRGGWWWRKKGGKCPRRRMDHHYSLTGKITSPGTGSEAICMMDQERKRQCHGVKNGGGGEGGEGVEARKHRQTGGDEGDLCCLGSF